MFLPVCHKHSKPAALLGYPKEIWSGLSCFCEEKVASQRMSPRMTLATDGNKCSVLGQGQLEGGRTTAEVVQLWSVACVQGS